MIKLTMIREHMDGRTHEQPVHVNPRQIQYYYDHFIGLDERRATCIVTTASEDLMVTETPATIDLLISGYRPGR